MEQVAANATITSTLKRVTSARNVRTLSQVVLDVNRLICQVNLYLSRSDM